MLRAEKKSASSAPDRKLDQSQRAFSLIELLVVMGIIGLLASVTVPAIRGIGRANTITAANRQLLDEINYARLRAITARTTVYMVFVPTNLVDRFKGETDVRELRSLSNLISGQLTSYALISKRTIGDQPGRESAKYLTEWKNLPDGALFPMFKYSSPDKNPYFRQWDYVSLPFPNSRSKKFLLPCIAFNAQGQLLSKQDEIIPVAQGSVFYPRDKNDRAMVSPAPDAVFTPPGNFTNNFIRINWLTGRPTLETPQLQ